MAVTKGIFLRSSAVGSSVRGWRMDGVGVGARTGRKFPSFRRPLTPRAGRRGLPRESFRCLASDWSRERDGLSLGTSTSLQDSTSGFWTWVSGTLGLILVSGVFPRLCPLARVEAVLLTPFLDRLFNLFGIVSSTSVVSGRDAGFLSGLGLGTAVKNLRSLTSGVYAHGEAGDRT